MVFHAEDDGGDDDSGQGGLGYEGGVGHEEGEAEEDEEAGVEAAHGRPHPAGGIDCGPTEGPGDWHGLDKTARQVTQTQGQHLLRGVHRLPLRCKHEYNQLAQLLGQGRA